MSDIVDKEKLKIDAGLQYLPTDLTYELRMAVTGHQKDEFLSWGYHWEDKPHRLVYAACREVEAQAVTITRLTAERDALADDRDGYVQLLTDQNNRLTAEVEQNAIDLEEYKRDVERLRAALLVARKYVLVQSCELSLKPEDAARDLDVIDEALEEDDNG